MPGTHTVIILQEMTSKFDTLTKGLVCDKCGGTKWIPKLGGTVCSSCFTFVDYANIKPLKKQQTNDRNTVTKS